MLSQTGNGNGLPIRRILKATIRRNSRHCRLLAAPREYAQTDTFGFSGNLAYYTPVWGYWADIANNIWIWSEVIVVLFNRKRRAIHDFIAGTIVVVDPRPQLEDLHP